MIKPIFPRILLIALLYVGIFILLASVQFAHHSGSTLRIGEFVVSGQFSRPGGDGSQPNQYFIGGNVQVVFGGMGFDVAAGSGGRTFNIIGIDGSRAEELPVSMIVTEDAAQFLFADGTELVFAGHNAGGVPEINITGVFAEDVAGVELPFTPQKRTRITDSGTGNFSAHAGGVHYRFVNSPIDPERMVLRINAGSRPVSYRAVTDFRIFSPHDFILAQAETAGAYNEFLGRWRDRNNTLWNSLSGNNITGVNSEDIVLARLTEAFARRNYSAAVAAVPASFLNGPTRTFKSSVFLGGLDQTYRSIVVEEQEKLATISRQIEEGSPLFLGEPRVIEFLAVRGHNNLIAAASNIVSAINPADLNLDIIPGIFEGHRDWRLFRSGTENPFEHIVEQAQFAISELLRRTANHQHQGNHDGLRDLVFVANGGQGEAEFNLRLGKALMRYAEGAGNETWAGIGRSIVISALSMGDAFDPEQSARDFNFLNPTEVYPRAVAIGTPGIWAWTASNEVRAVQQSDALDISVRFPAGESHYMIISGVQPFVRLQLYNIDYRSDPQFERFDSSGWRYMAQEQILLVKMRHRADIENIRIIFREAPRAAARPAPPPAPPQPAQVEAIVSDAGVVEITGEITFGS